MNLPPGLLEVLRNVYPQGTTDVLAAAGAGAYGWRGMGAQMMGVPALQRLTNEWRIAHGLPAMPVWTAGDVAARMMGGAGYLLGRGQFPVGYAQAGAVTGRPWGDIYEQTAFWREFMGRGTYGALYGTEFGVFAAAQSFAGHAAILSALAAGLPIPSEWQTLYDYLRRSGQIPVGLDMPPDVRGMEWERKIIPGATIGAPAPYRPWQPREEEEVYAQQGLEMIVNRPMRIHVGEGGRRERVTVTPLAVPQPSGGVSLDDLDWRLSTLISKRIMRGIAARA